MIPFSETAEKLGLHAYVRIENYQFMQKRADNIEAENARLKAEVEAVTQEYSDATNHYNKLHNNLQAEVERLRKAGDAMKDAVETYFELMPMLVNEVRAKAMLKGRKAIQAWNAAKEGKPSV